MSPSSAKPNLTSLRCLLSFFFAGIGCLLPFFSFHSQSLGLTLDDSRIISIVCPFIAFLGPILFGPLVDHLTSKPKKQILPDAKFEQTGCIRRVLMITILLSAVFYNLLLFVPKVRYLPPRHPFVLFNCAERGAVLVQERFNNKGCYQYPYEKSGPLLLTGCQFKCEGKAEGESLETEILTTTLQSVIPAETHPTIAIERDLDKFFGNNLNEESDDEDFGSGEEPGFWNSRRRKRFDVEPSPHICTGVTNRLCNVFTPYTTHVKVNITLKNALEEEETCVYNLGGSFFCRIPPDVGHDGLSCKVVCDIKDAYGPNSVFMQSQIVETEGDPRVTFWGYLLFKSLGDLFTAVTISLLIGVTLTAVRLKIGREFVFPSLTYAVGAFVMGLCYSRATLSFHPIYVLGIWIFGVCSVISVVILIMSPLMPIGPPDWWSSHRDVQMRHKAEFSGLLLVLLLCGILWGPYYQHTPWHLSLHSVKVPEMYIGSSVALGAFLSIPFVWKADTIVDYCGYSNILISSLTFFILRYTGLLLIKTPWILLITGGLEVFTLALLVFSTIFYVRQLVPKHLIFTAQSLAFGIKFCLGNALGCLIAYFLSPSELELSISHNQNATEFLNLTKNFESDLEEEKEEEEIPYTLLYRAAAIFAALVAAIYFLLYHGCLKKKCLAPQYRKSESNGTLPRGPSGNGNYTPLRLLHNGRQATTATD